MAQVENLSGKRIKVQRSDNGGEYTFGGFNDFCKEAEEGIYSSVQPLVEWGCRKKEQDSG